MTLNMENYEIPFSGGSVLFFHISTDGESNGIVHTCDEDYRQANTISALCAERTGVHIVVSVHMSTHSHFVIWCETDEMAWAFSNSYKRDYARYASLEHGMYKVYSGIDAEPKAICDIYHLKNSIAYVLLNPVAAGIVHRAEDYRWSSFEAYFNKESPVIFPVSSLPTVTRRRLLRTKMDMSFSRICVLENGDVYLKSFIDYSFVERLFGGRMEFYRALALTDSVKEEERYVHHTVKYNDNELLAEALNITKQKFGKPDLVLLTKHEKTSVLQILHKKTGATPRRMARVLRLDPKFVLVLFGRDCPKRQTKMANAKK